MEDVKKSVQPSLERLKALDSLPDLSSQLAEASQLCTHSARADMIAKWLLEKLKSAQEIRSNAEAWRSLHSTIRLLSPERLATHLTSYNFLKTLSLALEETQISSTLLYVLKDIVAFLLDISTTANGAPVRAALSTSASQAASFLGLWFQNVYDGARLVNDPTSCQSTFSIIGSALQIWSLRKPSTDENELFAKHCLIPGSALLKQLSSIGAVATKKRKRDDKDAESWSDAGTVLETLLARHVFLPSRTAFFKAQDPEASKGQKQVGSQHPESLIKMILEPLKTLIAQGHEQIQSHLEALPLLLEIALLCVSTPTLRQRTKEKPWIEAVFQALHQCNVDSAGVTNRTILTQMLQVVGARASLSKGTLQEIVQSYSILSSPPKDINSWEVGSLEDWKLIAQVVELNADVFTEPKMVEPLFTKITKAGIEVGGLAANGKDMPSEIPPNQDLIHGLQTLLSERIVIPIMKAFGQSRNLMTFVDLWLEQLEQDVHDQIWSVWTELDSDLQSILEDSIMESEILGLFERLSKPIADFSTEMDTDEVTTVPPNLGPNIVILNSMLGGVQNESLVNEITVRCESLLGYLMKLLENSASSAEPNSPYIPNKRRIWTLMTKAFEIWFPSWASEQIDAGALAEKCGWLMSRFALQLALSTAQTMRSAPEATLLSVGEARDAECFIASLCYHVSPYRESLQSEIQNVLAETLDKLFKHLGFNHSLAICLYPDLMLLIPNSQRRRDFLAICVAAATNPSNNETPSDSPLDGLLCLVSAAVTSAKPEVIDDVVRVSADLLVDVPELSGGDIEQELRRKDFVAIEMLSQIPITILTRAQRESILDALCTTKWTRNHYHQETLRCRLALMIKLIEIPNATSRLSTDHTAIWRLALGISAVEYPSAGKVGPQIEELQTLSLLCEVARLTVKHLMTTKDQERSHSTLLDLSMDVKVVLESICHSEDIRSQSVALALCNAVLQELESSRRHILREPMPHRDTQVLKMLSDKLLSATKEAIPTSIDSSWGSFDSEGAISSKITMDMLSTIADLFVTIDVETSESVGKAIQADLDLIDLSRSVEASRMTELPLYQAALVKSFKICCTHVRVGDDWLFADVALRLLSMELEPNGIEDLIESFEERVKELDADLLFGLIEILLPTSEVTHQSGLLLLQSCLVALRKDDISNTTSTGRYHVLPRLLHIAIAAEDPLKFQRATSCLLIALKEKPFLNNQHTVDTTLASLPKLLDGRLALSIAYLDVCQVMSALLLNHRARLQGRFHLVNKVFQALISKLFEEPEQSLSNRALGRQLASKHAHALARALTLFCEPLLLRQKSSASGLTDESRKEQAHVGQYIQYVLHRYCSQVLNGSLGDGVKEALTPALWAMIDAIEINDTNGVKSLSASMNNSERAILRGVYDDWRRFGKWRGG